MSKNTDDKTALPVRKIFIVDDDVSMGRSLEFLLTTYGYEVETFSSGPDFFRAVAPEDSGLLILDIHMPGMDGFQIQEKCGAKRRIIMMTAHSVEGQKERALRAGAMGFISKPFRERDLLAMIEQAFA